MTHDSLIDLFGDRIAPDGAFVRDNFLRWFQASKVVDDAGHPLIVFHGTASDFLGFEGSHVGSRHVDLEVGEVFYFSTDRETASWYAQSANEQAKGGGNVRPVYLSLQNPLIVDFQGTGIETLAEDIEQAKLDGHDGLIAHRYDDGTESTHCIAFSPMQIKSALGNSGLYDPANPDTSDLPTPAQRAVSASSWLSNQEANPPVRGLLHAKF